MALGSEKGKASLLSFAIIFSQSVTGLLIFLTASFTELKSVIVMKASVSFLFLCFAPLALYLKPRHKTRGRADFPLCYLLGVL